MSSSQTQSSSSDPRNWAFRPGCLPPTGVQNEPHPWSLRPSTNGGQLGSQSSALGDRPPSRASSGAYGTAPPTNPNTGPNHRSENPPSAGYSSGRYQFPLSSPTTGPYGPPSYASTDLGTTARPRNNGSWGDLAPDTKPGPSQCGSSNHGATARNLYPSCPRSTSSYDLPLHPGQQEMMFTFSATPNADPGVGN